MSRAPAGCALWHQHRVVPPPPSHPTHHTLDHASPGCPGLARTPTAAQSSSFSDLPGWHAHATLLGQGLGGKRDLASNMKAPPPGLGCPPVVLLQASTSQIAGVASHKAKIPGPLDSLNFSENSYSVCSNAVPAIIHHRSHSTQHLSQFRPETATLLLPLAAAYCVSPHSFHQHHSLQQSHPLC